MKRAVISDEVSQDFDEVLRFAREHALDGIEIRSIGNRPPHRLDDRQIEQIRAATRTEGLAICGIASPVFKCEIEDTAQVREQIGILERCMEVAEAWRAPMIRVFTGWRRPHARELLPRVAAIFRQDVLPLLDGKPYWLGVENEYSTNMATGEESRQFLDAVAAANVRLVWDPCNILFLPDATDPLDDYYGFVRGRVSHLHVKDAVRVEEQEARAVAVGLGEGAARVRETLQALAADGYDGWVSLETHWRLQGQLAEDVTRSPMGTAFSAGAAAASRVCMERLNTWLAAAR